ncbi:hypothetical protein CBER1_06236 [Cercospora berteroae]|uniref:Ubiquitin 3 binding protein But2 C-terminal domain-containing protein n=1 Tax=Cercospora berteroae TaxID=357750 RepID=A0A2S6CCR0_9PEZI|nr:hypothetical protein CBER1_06236 [Cercospora berteroae]
MLWLLIACLLGVVVAEPQRQYTNNNNNKHFCSSVKKIVTAFKQQGPASKYCSSYLNIAPSVTTSTVTVPPTSGPCQPSAVVSPRLEAGKLLKRRPYEPKPKCFAGYTKKSVIASACSCIVTRPKPVTTTVTVTSGAQPLPTTPSTFRIQAVEVDDSEVPESAALEGNYARQQRRGLPLPDVGFNVPPATPESALIFTFVPGTNNVQTSSDIIRVLIGERPPGEVEVAREERLELAAAPGGQESGSGQIQAVVNCTIVPREDQTCTLNCVRPGFPTDRTHFSIDEEDGDAQWRISDRDTVSAEFGEVRFRSIAVEVLEG